MIQMKWKTTDPFLIYPFCQNTWNNLPRICQHTVCSASISLLTGPGIARRLFFSAYSMISLPSNDSKISVLLLLYLTAAFDTRDHEIVLSRLKHDFGIRVQPWTVSILPFWQKTICPHIRPKIDRNVPGLRCTSSLCARPCTVHFLYNTTYIPRRKTLYRHEIFADTTQLSHSKSPENYLDLVRSLQECVKHTGLWMEENKLKLNKDQTEAIRFSSSSTANTTLQQPQTISLSNTDIEFAGMVRNLASSSTAISQWNNTSSKRVKLQSFKSDA